MNKFSKIIATIGIVFLFLLIFGIVVSTRHDAGYITPGIGGLILYGLLFIVLRAIWKKSKNKQ